MKCVTRCAIPKKDHILQITRKQLGLVNIWYEKLFSSDSMIRWTNFQKLLMDIWVMGPEMDFFLQFPSLNVFSETTQWIVTKLLCMFLRMLKSVWGFLFWQKTRPLFLKIDFRSQIKYFGKLLKKPMHLAKFCIKIISIVRQTLFGKFDKNLLTDVRFNCPLRNDYERFILYFKNKVENWDALYCLDDSYDNRTIGSRVQFWIIRPWFSLPVNIFPLKLLDRM